MQSFFAADLSPTDNYKLLVGAIVPRPIAWVSTVDANGIRNLAPFSWFTAVSANPPVVCFCPSPREAKNGLGPTKDTLENVRATGEFVVNIVSDETVEAMNATAAQLPPEEDEFLRAGVTATASETVRPPRVAEAKVQMECRLKQIIEVSNLPGGGALVLGDVLRFHLEDAVLAPGFHIVPAELRAVGPMAGSPEVNTNDRIDLERAK